MGGNYNFDCKMSCLGFHAEIQYSSEEAIQNVGIDDHVFSDLAEEYTAYRKKMMRNLAELRPKSLTRPGLAALVVR